MALRLLWCVVCLLCVHFVAAQDPPQSSSAITTQPPRTEPLQQGDTITCTVSGGKPRVTNVTFYCHPDHEDEEDDVSDDGSDVSSSITVNISKVTDQSMTMTCVCYASWDPEPELYSEITRIDFDLKFTGSMAADHSLPLSVVIGAVSGAVAVVVVAVITVVVWMYRQRRRERSRQSLQMDQIAEITSNTIRQRQLQQQQPDPQQNTMQQDQYQSNYERTQTAEPRERGNVNDVFQQETQDDVFQQDDAKTDPMTANDAIYLHPINDLC